mmetsp:Transcript_21026/g.59165  ORF Transcript_21026/g.59165 Transcript_21026/m.59165 type:complete len:318 (-) Transcript_21026:72-1025(-)
MTRYTREVSPDSMALSSARSSSPKSESSGTCSAGCFSWSSSIDASCLRPKPWATVAMSAKEMPGTPAALATICSHSWASGAPGEWRTLAAAQWCTTWASNRSSHCAALEAKWWHRMSQSREMSAGTVNICSCAYVMYTPTLGSAAACSTRSVDTSALRRSLSRGGLRQWAAPKAAARRMRTCSLGQSSCSAASSSASTAASRSPATARSSSSLPGSCWSNSRLASYSRAPGEVDPGRCSSSRLWGTLRTSSCCAPVTSRAPSTSGKTRTGPSHSSGSTSPNAPTTSTASSLAASTRSTPHHARRSGGAPCSCTPASQ